MGKLAESKKITIEWSIFLPSIIILVILATPLVLWEKQSMELLNHLYSIVELKFGWFFILSVNIFVALGIYMMFSKYGKIVLGDPNEKPMMPMFTYTATIICTTLGATIIRTGSGQWAKWITTPPLNIDPGSIEAIRNANVFGITFWGFQYMAICALIIPATAYMLFVRKKTKMRLSELYRGILGDKFADGILGRIADIIFIICMIAGNAVVLGLGSPIATTTIAKIFNIEPSFGLTMTITLMWVLLFTISVSRGLEKGIALLSLINIKLGIILGIVILLIGPTAFIMAYFTESIGLFMANSIEMMFFTDAVGTVVNGEMGDPAKWSVFWWAYSAAGALIYGLFAASISRGRTIRQVLLVYYLTPLSTCFIAHGILGGTAIHQWLTGTVPLMETFKTLGEVHIIPEMITALPFGNIILVFVAILIILFLVTTLHSVCYSLACYTEKKDMSSQEPGKFSRVAWAVTIAFVALTLMNIGGLPPLEIAVVLTGIFMIIAEFLIFLAGIKMFNQDKAWINNIRKPNEENL